MSATFWLRSMACLAASLASAVVLPTPVGPIKASTLGSAFIREAGLSLSLSVLSYALVVGALLLAEMLPPLCRWYAKSLTGHLVGPYIVRKGVLSQ